MTGTGSSARAIRALRVTPIGLGLAIALCGSAGAVDVDYEVGVAAKRSDNVNLSEFDPVSDTVISPRLYFEADQSGTRVQLSAKGDFEYLHYTGDTFDDETRGRFAGSLNWSVLPGHVDFVLQDYLSLLPVDELVAYSPTNQQQVNVLTAGPTFHARFSPTTRGKLDLRYINSYAEENDDFNSDRYGAAARLIHDIDKNHSVSANVEATDVRFDRGGTASDYRRYDGYVTTEMRRRQFDLSADLGYTRLERDISNDRSSHPLARVRLDWRLSPRSLLGTTVRYQVSDATESLMEPLEFQRRDFNDFDIPYGLVEPDVFRERMIRTRYVYRGERGDLQVAPYYRRIRYIDNAVEDQDRRGARLSLDYRLKPRLTLSLFASAENRDYVGIVRKDKDRLASIGLANRFTRHWTGRIDLQRRERDSSAFGRSYDENAVMVSFSYRR